MINGLDLFSGYGGISLALREWVRPIIYCEKERFAQGILLSRMSEGFLPNAPIWDDISTLDGKPFKGYVDIIYGGFPCQDISVAGNGKGLAGERSGLFFEVCRLVEEIQPRFIFLENVPAIRTRGLREVVRTLTALGYDCRWTCISAEAVGAPHLRRRWFLLAHANGKQLRHKSGRGSGKDRKSQDELRVYGQNESVANTHGEGLEVRQQSENKEKCEATFRRGWWSLEPNVGRVVNGCPFRVDRIKALGNGVVPLQVRKAFEKLLYSDGWMNR